MVLGLAHHHTPRQQAVEFNCEIPVDAQLPLPQICRMQKASCQRSVPGTNCNTTRASTTFTFILLTGVLFLAGCAEVMKVSRALWSFMTTLPTPALWRFS